ncbi:hypothetical protein MMC27_001220 [Xylographa pallens]|nr:hypothetical protein [Xylographa pallens]
MFFFASLLPLLAGSYFLACLPSAGGSQFIDHDGPSLLAVINGPDKVLRRADAPFPAVGDQPVQPQAPAPQAPPAAQPQPVAQPQAPAQQAPAQQAPAQQAPPAAQAQAGHPLQAPAQQVIPAVQPQAGVPAQAPAQPGVAPIINLPAAQFAGPQLGNEEDLRGPNCMQCLMASTIDCTNCVSLACTTCILTAACGCLDPSYVVEQCPVLYEDCQDCLGSCFENCRRPRIAPLPSWWRV